MRQRQERREETTTQQERERIYKVRRMREIEDTETDECEKRLRPKRRDKMERRTGGRVEAETGE